jgi:hypothetical protein
MMKSRHLLAVLALLASATATAEEGVSWDSLNEEQKQVLSVFADAIFAQMPTNANGAGPPRAVTSLLDLLYRNRVAQPRVINGA